MGKVNTMNYQELMKHLATKNLNKDDVEGLIRDSFWLDSIEKIKAEKEKWSDFWNDKSLDGNYYCDLFSEWADSKVDVYYAKLTENLMGFANYIDEALEEWLVDRSAGIRKIIQAWQYKAYEQRGSEVLEKLRNLDL